MLRRNILVFKVDYRPVLTELIIAAAAPYSIATNYRGSVKTKVIGKEGVLSLFIVVRDIFSLYVN